MAKTFLVIGGDLRQIYLASRLSKEYEVNLIGFTKNLINDSNIKIFENPVDYTVPADYAVLPIPASADGVTISCPFLKQNISLDLVKTLVTEGGTIFGGKMDNRLKRFCDENGFIGVDYLDREELAVANAVPTAEGALQTAMEELPVTIFGAKVLIIGFGRIGKVLTKMLTDLGADVLVSTGSYEKTEWIKIYGAKAISTSKLDKVIGDFDLIINTAPAVVLDRSKLAKIPDNTLIIDLASKPGGVDFESAKTLGKKTIWALSLPGKVAPKTSGEIIANTILNILEERGEKSG